MICKLEGLIVGNFNVVSFLFFSRGNLIFAEPKLNVRSQKILRCIWRRRVGPLASVKTRGEYSENSDFN